MPDGPALAYEQVSRRYAGVSAVDRVSLSITRGSFVALVGKSGSGKSTLLRLANRLDAPDEGRVLVDGQDVAHGDPIRLRRSIGYVFQNIGLFPHLSVAENIGYGLRRRGMAVPQLVGGLRASPRLERRLGPGAARYRRNRRVPPGKRRNAPRHSGPGPAGAWSAAG